MDSKSSVYRIKEIREVLQEPKNKVHRRIKKAGLHKPHLIWFVAVSIARAERHVEVIRKIQSEKMEAEKQKKNEKIKRNRRIKKAEELTGRPPVDLYFRKKTTLNACEVSIDTQPDYVRDTFMPQFMEHHGLESNVEQEHLEVYPGSKLGLSPEYRSAVQSFNYAKDRQSRLLKQKTKPKEKAVAVFCRDMKILFVKRGLRPNYKLIADLINLFNLSKMPETSDSIRTRFSRDPQL